MPRRPRDPGVPSSPAEYFGTELRAKRELSNLSRPQLAEKLGYSPQRIGQVETNGSPPSEDFAKDCDVFFKTDGSFHRIWKWIQDFGRLAVLPPGFPDFIERERKATGMCIFETMVVTGLFQTPEYAYEVLKEGRAPNHIEQLVATRMERQAILQREDPPHVVAIFDEGVLRRPIGNNEVMKAQIRHLIELAGMHNITMQIVPLSRGAYAGLPGNFTVMRFAFDPYIVHIGGYEGAQLIDHVESVQKCEVQFDLIRGAAMSTDESLNLLWAILESL